MQSFRALRGRLSFGALSLPLCLQGVERGGRKERARERERERERVEGALTRTLASLFSPAGERRLRVCSRG